MQKIGGLKLKQGRNHTTGLRIIKKYAGRKMYDMKNSKFITLGGIAELLADGEEVLVIDNKTGEDITLMVLTQIILEQQRKGTAPREHSLSSISNLLRKIAKMGSRPVSNFLEEPSFGNLGIISLTERKLKEIVERLVKMGKVSRGEKDSVLEVLLAKVEESKRELENFIREILSHMNIPTRLEFENLKREIEQLKKQIVKENG